jgi:MFS family permease
MKIGLQLEIVQIGLITAIFPAATIMGALIGGTMADRWGRKITLYVFIGTSIVFSASLILANTWQILAIIFGMIGFLRGGYYASSMAMVMDVTNPKIGATQYSVLTATFNVGEMSGQMMSGSLVAMLGFSRVFLYSAWVFGPALLILHFIKLKKAH